MEVTRPLVSVLATSARIAAPAATIEHANRSVSALTCDRGSAGASGAATAAPLPAEQVSTAEIETELAASPPPAPIPATGCPVKPLLTAFRKTRSVDRPECSASKKEARV